MKGRGKDGERHDSGKGSGNGAEMQGKNGEGWSAGLGKIYAMTTGTFGDGMRPGVAMEDRRLTFRSFQPVPAVEPVI